MNKVFSAFWGSWVVVALAGASAHAYVPPSQFIIKTVAAKHSGIKGVRITSHVDAISKDKPSGPHFKQETVYDAQTGALRSSAFDDNGKVLYTVERHLFRELAHEQEGSAIPFADLIELGSKADILIAALKSLEIPIKTEDELVTLGDENERYAAEVTSIGRIRTQFAWIIGESSRPQFWVEKDTFLPIRVIVKADKLPEISGSDGSVEIRFENYRFVREFPVSRLVSITRNGETLVREEASDVAVNPSLSEFKKPVTSGYTEAGNSADSGVRELLRQYYSALR